MDFPRKCTEIPICFAIFTKIKKMKTLQKTLYAAMAIIALTCMHTHTSAETRDKSKAVKELSEDEFNLKVYDIGADKLTYLGKLPAIIDFTATWCGPCQKTAPVLEEIAKEYKDKILVYKVDVDKCRKLAQAMGVSSIPAILYIPLPPKEPVMTVGARGKDRFKEEIGKYL